MPSSLTMKEGGKETSEMLTLQQEDPGRKKTAWSATKKTESLSLFLFLGRDSWDTEVWWLQYVHQIWERGEDTFWTIAILNGASLKTYEPKKKSKNSRQRRHKPQWNKPKNDRISYFKKHTSPIDQTQDSNVILRKLIIVKQKCPVIYTAWKEAVVHSWHSINKKLMNKGIT